MKSFTIACINPSKNELWQIHKSGCRDLSNGRTRNIDAMYTVNDESPEAVEDKWLDEEMREMGYQPGDGSCKIMPCCKDAAPVLQPVNKSLASLSESDIVAAFKRSGDYTEAFSIENLKFEKIYINAHGDQTAVYSGDIWDDVEDAAIPLSKMYISATKIGLLGSF